MSRIFVTGATGFIGSHLVAQLIAAGHDVTALCRGAAPRGVRVVRGHVERPDLWCAALAGHDVVIHLAAIYQIGYRDRRAMYQVNVLGTRAVLDAAIAAGVPRIVHVSSTAALGDTRGATPGEEHRHDGMFRSYYEETKHIAHGIAQGRIAAGAPVMIAIPGGVFGEGDRSVLATTLRDFRRGKLPIQVATTSQFQLCHVARVCEGLIQIAQRGTLGAQYLLTGTVLSMPELLDRAAALDGRAVPRAVSRSTLRPIAAACDALGKLGVALPLSREALRVMDGSTYTYRSEKAQRELGWDPGDVEADLSRYLQAL